MLRFSVRLLHLYADDVALFLCEVIEAKVGDEGGKGVGWTPVTLSSHTHAHTEAP